MIFKQLCCIWQIFYFEIIMKFLVIMFFLEFNDLIIYDWNQSDE